MVCLTCFMPFGFLKVCVLSFSPMSSVLESHHSREKYFFTSQNISSGEVVKKNAKYYDSINEILRLGNSLIIMVQGWQMDSQAATLLIPQEEKVLKCATSG